MKSLPFLLLLSLCGFAVAETPKLHIEKGCKCFECPYFQKGETKGIWIAKKDVQVFSNPGKTEPIAIVRAGEKTVAIAGEVHTTPGILEVLSPKKKYKINDEVYILSEDADAGYKVWHDGLEDIEDLSIMVSQKEPCKTPSTKCWAKVKRPLTSVWWVQLQLRNKSRGWTKAVDDFDFDRSTCL